MISAIEQAFRSRKTIGQMGLLRRTRAGRISKFRTVQLAHRSESVQGQIQATNGIKRDPFILKFWHNFCVYLVFKKSDALGVDRPIAGGMRYVLAERYHNQIFDFPRYTWVLTRGGNNE